MLSRAYTPSICMPAKVAFLGPLLLTPSTPLHLIGSTPLYLHACNPGISLRPYDYLLFTVGVTPALIRAHLLWHIYVSPQNDPCNPRDLGPLRHLIKVTKKKTPNTFQFSAGVFPCLLTLSLVQSTKLNIFSDQPATLLFQSCL